MRRPFNIQAITSALGSEKISIRSTYPDFSSVIEKTGIESVRASEVDATELAIAASKNLLSENVSDRELIGAVVVVTQSPSYFLPGISSVVHHELNLRKDCITFDVSQGCAGFVHGLIIANGFLNDQSNVLLICTDTYRRKISQKDRATVSVFSDGATACLLTGEAKIKILAEEHYSEGSGRRFLYQRTDSSENSGFLHMSGSDVFVFAKRVVEKQIRSVVRVANLTPADVDLVVPHQASLLVLSELARKLTDFSEFVIDVQDTGNLVSSSIPFILQNRLQSLRTGTTVLSGFGVGLSSSSVVLSGIN